MSDWKTKRGCPMGHSRIRSGRNIWVVILLSLLPGASLVYLGRIKKTLPLFIVDLGIILGFVFSRSYLLKLIIINIYIFTFLVPFVESYQLSRYGKNTVSSNSRWYVIVLLLATGFNALPMLWQSAVFSRKAKVAWTIVVPVLAAVFFTVLITYYDRIEEALRAFPGQFSALNGRLPA